MINQMSGAQITPAQSSSKPALRIFADARMRDRALLVVVIWLAFAALPLIPAPAIPGLDPSWVLGLNVAHTQGLVHGRDIVWTYGPLAYLAYPDAAGHSMYAALLFRLGIYLLWCLALFRLLFAIRERTMAAWAVVLIGFSAILDPLLDHLGLAFFTWALLVVIDRSRWRTPALGVLAFLSAVACLVKANSGIEAACLFASVTAVVLFQDASSTRKKLQIAGAALLFPLATLLLYAAETGSVRAFPAYVRNSLEMASAYSEEMSYNGPLGQVLIALVGLGVLFLVLPLAERPIRNLAAGFLPALVYAFFSFKSCMVRQDAHAADFELRLALAALFLLLLARGKWFVYAAVFFQVVCVIISHYYISAGWPTTNAVVASRLTLRGNWSTLNGYLHWSMTWSDWERESRENLLPMRVEPELASAIGNRSIEVLPWEVSRVEANGWHWNPRPIFQTYAAYSPALDHLNADYLKSGRGPDLDLWSWDDIDGRHPFLDAPFSWQTQLDFYQTVTTNSELLLLGRRPAPRFQTVAPIGGDTTTWGRENRVPESADPIIVSARIERSLAGRLRSFLFRSNPLFIEVTRRSGKTERYRAPRANFADGVIINQLPGTLGDLAVLGTSGCTLSDPVVSFQFETASRGEFEQPISLEWARLVRGPELPANCVQITQTSAKAPVWGGFRSVAVSAGAATSWTATANESWVVLPQEPPRNGNAAVGLTVLKNSGAESRLGTVTFGGRAFKVLQAGSGATLSGHGIMQFGFYASPADVQLPRDANFDLLVDRFDAFSAPKGQPVLGDWTGSGVTRIGMFRDGRWYLDLNGNGRWDGKDGGDGVFSFGLPGDIAVPGDWAGDGKTRLGVFRHGEWAFDMNGNLAFDRGDKFVQFGIAGDIPVVSKWSHDRMDRVGVYRDGEWIVDSTGDGVFEPTDERFGFGLPGDKPLVSFGNGKVGVYRNGTCILGLGDTKAYDPKTAMTILCGPSHPLIAAW